MPVRITDEELSTAALARKTYIHGLQRRELEQSIADTEAMLNDPIVRSNATIEDDGALRKQIAREQKMLAENIPPDYDMNSKRKLKQKAEDLKASFTHALPTYTQMQRARPDDQDWHIAWERQHQEEVRAYQSCLKILDPYNLEPNFLSIARLRSETTGRDPRKYSENYDKIAWSNQTEIERLDAELDDAAYAEFLEMKAAGWSTVTICRMLGWEPPMFEAAMARMRAARPDPDALPLAAADAATAAAAPNGHGVPSETAPDAQVPGEDVEVPPAWTSPPAPWAPGWPLTMDIRATGMTVSQFAARVGMQRSTFEKYRRYGNFPQKWRKKVAQVLATTPSAPHEALEQVIVPI